MSDVLDVLSGLRVGPDSTPESMERLRERIVLRRRRRRRRSAFVGSLSLAVLAGAVLVVVVDDEGGSNLRTVDDPTTVPSTVAPGLSSPLPVGSVISSASGIEQVAESGDLVRLSDEPAARAFAIGDLVVWQGGEAGAVYPLPRTGSVLVLDGGDQRALPAEPGEELTLHDVGVVDGRAVAVVTARRGTSPEDTDERLVLIDLESNERADLGSVGGWEFGVSHARLVGDRIVTLAAVSVEQRVVVRSLDGAVVWEAAEPVVDGSVGLAVDGEEVLQIEPNFVGDDFEPQLDITRYELSTGTPISTEPLAVRPTKELEITGGICFAPELLDRSLICDQSPGAPIAINLDTSEATFVTGVDHGVPTLPRAPVAAEPSRSGFDALSVVTIDGELVRGTQVGIQIRGLVHAEGTEFEATVVTARSGSGRFGYAGIGTTTAVAPDGSAELQFTVPNVLSGEDDIIPLAPEGSYQLELRSTTEPAITELVPFHVTAAAEGVAYPVATRQGSVECGGPPLQIDFNGATWRPTEAGHPLSALGGTQGAFALVGARSGELTTPNGDVIAFTVAPPYSC